MVGRSYALAPEGATPHLHWLLEHEVILRDELQHFTVDIPVCSRKARLEGLICGPARGGAETGRILVRDCGVTGADGGPPHLLRVVLARALSVGAKETPVPACAGQVKGTLLSREGIRWFAMTYSGEPVRAAAARAVGSTPLGPSAPSPGKAARTGSGASRSAPTEPPPAQTEDGPLS